jgi:hypothetical protein
VGDQPPERLSREQIALGGAPQPNRAHAPSLALDAEHVEEDERNEQAEEREA